MISNLQFLGLPVRYTRYSPAGLSWIFETMLPHRRSLLRRERQARACRCWILLDIVRVDSCHNYTVLYLGRDAGSMKVDIKVAIARDEQLPAGEQRRFHCLRRIDDSLWSEAGCDLTSVSGEWLVLGVKMSDEKKWEHRTIQIYWTATLPIFPIFPEQDTI